MVVEDFPAVYEQKLKYGIINLKKIWSKVHVCICTYKSRVPVRGNIAVFKYFFSWLDSPSGRRFQWGFEITLRHTTLSRTPLDEWSALRRDLYLTTNNIHKRQKSIHTQYDSSGWVIGPSQRPLHDNKQYSQKTEIHVPAGFEPTIAVSERPQTQPLKYAAAGAFTFVVKGNAVLRIAIACQALECCIEDSYSLAGTGMLYWG